MNIMNITFLKSFGKNKISSLKEREKVVVFCGAIFLIIILILKFIFEPFVEARHKLLDTITRRDKELYEMISLENKYKMLKELEDDIKFKIANRTNQFSLFGFLDQQAEKLKIKKNIKSIKPSEIQNDRKSVMMESAVDIKLEAVDLESLVKYLQVIESIEYAIYVKRILIQDNSNKDGNLDVTMQVVTFFNKK